MSSGAARRAVLEMLQPSAVRAMLICSEPSGAPRTKIVKLDAPAMSAPGGGAGGGCPAAVVDTAIATATPHPRIKWLESMSQHNTAIRADLTAGYDAARRRAAFFERDRGRIVGSGKDRASYLQGLLTNDVASLTAGDGQYAADLTPPGRMIADI